MPTPIQEEPESTIGRKPGELAEHPEPREHEHARSGAATRRDGDEAELGRESRDRDELPPPR